MAEDKGKKVAHQEGSSELPPPGDVRRDVLKERQDVLEQRAEELAEERQVHSINPDALKVENELAQHFNYQEGTMLYVTNARNDRRYRWANHASQHGIDVTKRMRKGWQVVRGADKECEHVAAADVIRRIGVLMLLWTTPENYEKLERYEEHKRQRIYGKGGALDAEITDHAGKHPGAFVLRETQRSSKIGTAAEMLGRPGMSSGMAHTAAQMLGEKLRDEIPGLPIPGKGR